MLVFQDSEMRYPFDFRNGVCCSRGRGKGVTVFETGLAFYVTQKGHAMFSGFRKQPRCCTMAQNPITNSNSMYIDVRHTFLRELVRQRDIKIVQVPSEFQHADILTKALAFDLFAFHRKFLMKLK